VHSLYQERGPTYVEARGIDQLEFYLHWPLQHSTLGNLDYYEHFFIDADADMEVLKAGDYRFTFFVSDGYEVFIDGQRIMGYDGSKEMDQQQIRTEVFLEEGVHMLEVRMFKGYGESGLTGYYRRLDGPERPPDVNFEPKGGRGLAIGLDDEFTRFHYPSWEMRPIGELGGQQAE
jgi:hypothetical protein